MERFHIIRSRQDVLGDIYGNSDLQKIFLGWDNKTQNLFLDMCTGVRGVKVLYDSFFKEVFNPDTTPERLEHLLSPLIGQQIRILKVLPNESNRIADEGSLLIMDIVVEMEDGSIANVECQRVGYHFPGQRAACYSSDLLMRQYRRVKKEKGSAFSYRDIKKVYSVIFYEKSPTEFHQFPNQYIHRSRQQSDTGVQLEMVQEYVFIPLDIFRKNHHNKDIKTEIEAWLTFLSSDRPEDILGLIRQFPCFEALYDDIYTLCLNTERVMGMFSKELLEMDRNTVQYMIDEMQDEINAMKAEITDKDAAIADKDAAIADKDTAIADKDAAINEQKTEIKLLRQKLASLGINADEIG